MSEQPAAFHDLPASSFPFAVQLLDAATREVRWEQAIEGPAVLVVPSRDEVNDGRPVISRIMWADGRVQEAGPDG